MLFRSSAVWGINGIGIIIFLFLVFSREQIASHLQLGVDGPKFLLILLCNAFLFVGGQFILWMLQYEQKPIKYLALSLFQFLGVLILNIIFIVFLDKGIVGVLYSKLDRKSTRLNSSHVVISYAVFCLKKKKLHTPPPPTHQSLNAN